MGFMREVFCQANGNDCRSRRPRADVKGESIISTNPPLLIDLPSSNSGMSLDDAQIANVNPQQLSPNTLQNSSSQAKSWTTNSVQEDGYADLGSKRVSHGS
ncbi:hypothetical protein L1987_18665 [Smallanthus sonchifolius]|uniref:Uncharacterized protein n=1 Tax=Smallanthus sonchifolius TaxID=185202 RepID=A0ACB9J0Y6_9ASTR|nr:hypothetical protein L1987_18665 [Smallanthus sonchifolius]